MDFIIDSFKDLSPLGWASQICGLIGLIIIFISYIFKKREFIVIASISFIFFILEQAFAFLYSNLIVSSVCFIRNILMVIFLFKSNKELPKWLIYSLIGLMWLLIIIYMAITNSFNVFDNYLPPIIVTMSTMTQNFKNEFIVKIGALLHESGFLLYYLIMNAKTHELPLSIFRQVILVIATIIGLIILIVLYIKKYKSQKEDINTENL